MDNYIVRIYRRGDCRQDSMVGLVESAESGEIQSFSSFRELTTILAGTSSAIEETATDKLYIESA